MVKVLRQNDELCALTDSLSGTIRWRLRDYEEMLKAELAMLVAMETRRERLPGTHRGDPRSR